MPLPAQDEPFDVAIVGCGPVGATLANLLGQYGLTVLVLEREAKIHPLPRAIHFDGEVMRVFETAGLRPSVESISRAGVMGMRFNNAAGETLMIRAGSAEVGQHGCANNHYFHQPDLEIALRAGLTRFSNVRLATAHEVSAIYDQGKTVLLQVRELASERSFAVRARYVIGCDGARSLVRKTMDVAMQDLGLHQPWLVFDLRLKVPVPELPGYTVQHCDPARPMTYCNVTGDRRRWEIMLMPGDDPARMLEPDVIWPLVHRWVSPDQADIERAAIYTFHSLIAQSWRQGRLLVAGDAAHQTPPFLGQGMCAGIRDASNLAWKLRAVLRDAAQDSLLDTYGTERIDHVRAFIELAVELGSIIQTTDEQAARERDARFKGGQTFQVPTPKLGPGLWQGQHPAVARMFPQPRLEDGALLDRLIGDGFSVIGDPDVLAAVGEHTRQHWRELRILQLPADGPSLRAWLSEHQVRAAVLRPDRHVLGVARSGDELEQVTDFLRARL
jgi:3-(3-hydroxy-phenyl)propionate hydroxylase